MTSPHAICGLLTTLACMAATLAMPCAARADDLASAAHIRGAVVYSTYCVLCHGTTGKGDGRAASLQRAPPADLTASRRSNSYRRQIIRNGGTAVGRSSSMPAWREVLAGEQIADVLVYLNAIAARSGAAPHGESRTATGTDAIALREASP